MGDPPFESIDVRFEVIVGSLLVLNTLSFGIGINGPWGDVGFTKGILGLVGFFLLYRSWFARTFGFYGLIPSLHYWKHPSRSISRISLAGIGTMMVSWLVGHPFQGFFAEPTALILSVCGMLLILLAIYAWLVFEGGLGDEEE